MRERMRRKIVTALFFVSIGCALGLQANTAQAQIGLSVTASFNSRTPITPNTPIEIHLSRALKDEEGRIAVIIDRSDVTSLFIIDNTRLVYSPALLPLPLGTSTLAVYLVGADVAWREVARFDLQVAKEKPAPIPTPSPSPQPQTQTATSVDTGNAAKPPAATETKSAASESKFKFTPSLTLAVKSQMAQFNFPVDTRPTERATFTDETLQLSLRSEGSHGIFSSQTQIDFAGSTFHPEALRFGTLGNDAPQIDLASYLVQLQIGRAKVAIGHTSFGSSRQLVNSFSSRGITVTVPITKQFDFSIAAMNGTNVVGYGNLFGLSKSKHQLESATLGVEFLPKRPGGFRLEFSAVTAYIQALNSFTQGSVNDVESSKGGSVRLIFTDKSQRFKFDGGFTRSQYRNPADPLVYQGTNTIAVPFLTRNARYFDVSFDVLRGFALTKSRHKTDEFERRAKT